MGEFRMQRRELLGMAAPVARTHAPAQVASAKGLPPPLPFAAMVLGRMAFGPKPGTPVSIAAFEALGADDDARLEAFVDQQLNPAAIVDTDADARLADPAFSTLNKTLAQQWLDHKVNGSPSGGTYTRDYPIREIERAVFVRAIYSNRQLLEVMADFWHNHFNVFGYDFYAQSTFSDWDKRVIRGNALGNFRTMLEETSRHPAMLYYLDNFINRVAGPNENYAREMIELHTLGAENYLGVLQQAEVPLIPVGEPGEGWPVGYVDADVYEATRVMTGWKVNDGGSNSMADDGSHYYLDSWHDRFQKNVLGVFFPANTNGTAEVPALLDRLAYHPGTARHIAGKLARRLISDDPPQEVIDFAARVFWDNRMEADQISQTVRAILLYTGVDDPDVGQFVPGCFRDIANQGGKLKRPFEAIVSALRACSVNFTIRRGDGESDSFMSRVDRTNQRPFRWRPPDGYPDFRQYWENTASLVQTWRTIDWALDENSGSTTEAELIPLIAITEAELGTDRSLHTPNNLANFWMTRIYGWSPDNVNGWRGTELHTKIAKFMRRDRNGVSYWEGDAGIGTGGTGNTDGIETNGSPHYWRSRLRGMVALILSSPVFMQR
jgi:uncharacterized protein (DUF1800 family)